MPVHAVTLEKSLFFQDDGYPIVVERREPQPPFPLHRHKFAELVIITAGSGLHAIRKEEYPVSAGDVFVITDNAPHEYRNMNALELINIMYDPILLDMESWDVRSLPGYRALFKLEPAYRRRHKFASRLRLNIENLAAVIAMIDRLDDELIRRQPGFQLMGLSRFMEMVVFLSRCYGNLRATSSLLLMRIAESITHIEQHFTENISLDELASIAHMSLRTFTRTFRAAMGDSPMNYLIGLRVARAAKMIREGDSKITEIAFQSGFSDGSYFTRQFKRIMGCTPIQYKHRI